MDDEFVSAWKFLRCPRIRPLHYDANELNKFNIFFLSSGVKSVVKTLFSVKVALDFNYCLILLMAKDFKVSVAISRRS
jgi:hypothetical protein